MIHRRLDTGADVNEPNELGETALMIAAEQGNLKLMEMLLEKGADLTAQGIPALSYAARRGRTKTVKYLMDKGVDVTKKGGGPNLVDVIHYGHIDLPKDAVGKGRGCQHARCARPDRPDGGRQIWTLWIRCCFFSKMVPT